jgi:hypothetical protein
MAIDLNPDDDVFILVAVPEFVFILQSSPDLFISVNTHDSNSTQHFGYIGAETRSFGVYFGSQTGSLFAHARIPTEFRFTVAYLPSYCDRCYFSTAPVESFRVARDHANTTIRDNYIACYLHAANWPVNMSLRFVTSSSGFLSIWTDSGDRPQIFRQSVSFWEVYNSSIFVALGSWNENGDSELDIGSQIVPPLLHFPYRACGFHGVIDPSSDPQLLIDETEFPDYPPPPTRPDRAPPIIDDAEEEGWGSDQADTLHVATAMIGLSSVAILAIVVGIIVVAVKKIQRHRKEAEISDEAIAGENVQHIPKASYALPQLPETVIASIHDDGSPGRRSAII